MSEHQSDPARFTPSEEGKATGSALPSSSLLESSGSGTEQALRSALAELVEAITDTDWQLSPLAVRLTAALNVADRALASSPASVATGAAADVSEIAREFVAYYTGPERHTSGGCGNCGGIPHSTTCFVGRFMAALASSAPLPDAAPVGWREIQDPEEDGRDTVIVFDPSYVERKVPAYWDRETEDEGGQCWRAADAQSDRLKPTHFMRLKDLPDPTAPSSSPAAKEPR